MLAQRQLRAHHRQNQAQHNGDIWSDQRQTRERTADKVRQNQADTNTKNHDENVARRHLRQRGRHALSIVEQSIRNKWRQHQRQPGKNEQARQHQNYAGKGYAQQPVAVQIIA